MVLRRLRLLNWSLRKLRLPIGAGDLVFEVGSGGNPHPASDVLVEKFVDSSHRLKSIKIDREIVLADACKLPFRDRAFDYSIAFHVLEHVDQPADFIREISRVSKAGYIETPNVLYERLFPLDVHLLEVAALGEQLLIFRKPAAVHDEMLQQADLVGYDRNWKAVFNSRPELFHVCYRWQGEIKYRIVNPDQSLSWHVFPEAGLLTNDASHPGAVASQALGFSVRQIIIQTIRFFYKLANRSKIDVDSLLVCPECKGSLSLDSETYHCSCCDLSYRASPIRDFTKSITPQG
jgi:SAM-dependent methyltransferase